MKMFLTSTDVLDCLRAIYNHDSVVLNVPILTMGGGVSGMTI